MTAVFALSLLSCGREVTGPGNGFNYGRARTASLALDPHMPSLLSQLVGASTVVPFERVRILLRRDDTTVALDTIVNFPSGADSLALTLTLPLPLNTPETGLPLVLSMAYINAQGDTVFRAGPTNILAVPVGATGGSQPISLPVRYDGIGAGAASVVIAPDSLVVVAGTTSLFTAEARDGQGAPIANTPLLFFTLDSTRALIANPGVGSVTWLPVRGTARIVAALPDGARADTAFVTVALPASQLVLGSGNAQVGPIGAALPQPLVARVLAADGVPVPGVEVVFAVATGGGSLSVLADTSDANGDVQTAWTLGTALGAQTVTATAAGLTGSPLTFTASADPSEPVQLAIIGQPTVGTAGAALAPALIVAVQDAQGNTVPSYTGAVSVAFSETQTAVLGGTTTVNAVAGLATFADLTINLTGTYTLVVSSDTLPVTVAAPMSIVAAEASYPDILVQPGDGVAGVVLPAFAAAAFDGLGNVATGFVGVATLTAQRSGSPVNVIVTGGEVTVIDGIATFNAVQIDTAGTYRMVIDFGSIGTYVTSQFTVAPAAASTIALLDGDTQSGVVTAALPAPLRVRVTDDFGNGVGGVAVTWSVVSGLAQFSDTVVVTDASGIAATTVILGILPSAFEFAASAAGLAGSPVSFTANATAGAATYLSIETQPATTTVAGVTLAPIIVAARDAQGNIATGFVGTVEVDIATGVDGVPLGGALAANAVAGIATFDQLVIETRGAYTLRFTSPGLTDTVSAAFDIEPAAPFVMQVLDGNAQSDTVGTVLPNDIRVTVLDIFGNGVPGQAVAWSITSGSGTLLADTIVTDIDGIAAQQLTLGTVAGDVTLQATIDGLNGSPVVFTATAIAGSPTVLELSAAPDTVAAGTIAGPIVATVRDEFGNVVSWYTDLVTIEANDAPGEIAAGTTTVAAVGGVATFDDLVFNATGGWFLDISTGGFTVGVNLTVVPGAPAAFAIVSGDEQTGFATFTLPAPLVVRITDAVGNPIVGDTVDFLVTAGGGTLTGGLVRDSVVTNSAGEAQTTWTLGGDTQVTHEVTASFRSLPALTFTATAEVAVANRTWTGAANALWTNTANWAEGVVPTATDSVRIPAGAPNMPTLGAAATISRLTVEDGATLEIFEFVQLTVNGSIRVPEALAILGDSGFVVANAPTTGTISGAFTFLTVNSGEYLVTAPLTVVNDLRVRNAAQLDVATIPISVGRDFFTLESGVLEMNPGADVTIGRDAFFTGGSTAGFLTGGTLRVLGNFSAGGANPQAFNAAAAHVVLLDGPGIQSVAFSNPDVAVAPTCVTSCFGTLSSPKASGGLTFGSSVKALGGMTVTGDTLGAPGHTLISAGQPTLTSTTVTAARVAWQTGLTRSPNFFVDTLVAWGAGSALIGFENIPTIVVGSHRITETFNADLIVEGELDVDGSGIVLANDLITRGSGRLRMTDATDSLIVTRDARFGGATEPGLMTAGVLQVGRNLTQSAAVGVSSIAADDGAPRIRMTGFSAFISIGDPANNPLGTLIISSGADADFGDGAALFRGPIILESGSSAVYGFGAEVVTFGGLVDSSTFGWGVQTTRFAGVNPLLPPYIDGEVIFANAAALTDSLSVGGSVRVTTGEGLLALNGQRLRASGFTTDDGGRLSMATAADSLIISGNVAFEGGTSVLTAGYLGAGAGVFQTVTPNAVQAGPAHETRLTGLTAAVLNFANPGFGAGESHLGRLVVAKSNEQANITLNTDVFVNGVFAALPAQLYTLTSGNARVVSRGASVSDITFINTRWELLDGSAVAPIANVTFDQMAFDAIQLRIARGGGTVQLQQPTFLSAPDGGLFLQADDTVADADVLTVAVTSPTPEFASGEIQALNGAVITGWSAFSVLNWGGYVEGGAWNDPGNWQQNVVPGPADSVVIGSADYAPVITTPVTVRSLVSAIGNSVSVNAALTVTDWLTIITAQGFAPITCGVGGEIVLAAVDSIVVEGTTSCAVRATSGRTALRGPFDVGSIAIENSAQVDVDTWTLTSAGALATRDAGTLRMGNPNSEVFVDGEARFEGGSTAGILTQGSLNLFGNFVQGVNATAFQPGTGHRTRFGGTVDQTITFANPDSTSAGSFFGILEIGQESEGSSVVLASDVFAIGPLETGEGFQRVFTTTLTEAPVVFSRGASASGMRFANVRWHIADGGTLAASLSDVRFEAMNIVGTNPPQLRMARTADAVMLTNFEFDTLSTADFIWVSDPSQSASASFAVTMASPIPAFHGGRIQTDGFASILNWSAEPSFTWTGAVNETWGEPGNWDGGAVPGPTDAVTIPGGTLFPAAIVADSITVGSVTMGAGAQLILIETSFVVNGSFLADPTATITADEDSPVALIGGGTVRGNFPSLFLAGDYTIVGVFGVDSTLGIVSGHLDPDGNSFSVGSLATNGTGTLAMLQGETITVNDLAFFGGGSTTGRLTSGRLVLRGDFVQAGDPTSFDAAAPHVTEFAPTLASPVVTFFNPALSGFGNLELSSGRTELGTATAVRGDLTFVGGPELDGPGAISVVGNINGTEDFAEMFVPRVAFGGAFNFLGVYDADTTEFIGTGQAIPTQPNPQQTVWRHMIVSGTTTFSGAALSIDALGSLTIAAGGELAILGGGSIDLFTTPITAELGGTLRVATGGAFRSRAHSEVEGALVIESAASAVFNSGGLDGQHLFPAGSSVSGAGSFSVDGANLVEIAGAFDVGTLLHQNATLAFNSADTAFVGGGAYAGGGFLNGTGVLGIRGAFSSTGGNPNGTGTIAVLPGGTFTLASPLRGWNLDIGGTLIWGNWDLSLEQFNLQDPGIVIRAGGLLDMQHGGEARNMFANSANLISNLGSILKSSGSATTLVRAQVVHSGFMDALSGELSFQFACQVTSGTFGTGGGTITNCGP